jgi:acyl-CoA synthetase (AMP-forming)/AMP-acid ligase II
VSRSSHLEGTIPQIVESAATRFGGAEAVVDGDVRWSFAELDDHVRGCARALIRAGVAPGDRVAIWAPNMHEWLVAALGLQTIGAVLVPINTRFKGREAVDLLERTSARLLFTVSDFLGTDYVALLRDAGIPSTLEQMVILRGAAPPGTTAFADFLAGAEPAGGGSDEQARATRAAAVAPDDLAAILFTSGTTGRPKGAMLRHGAVARAYTTWSEVVGLRSGDRYLIVNPFFHAFGYQAGVLACLIAGATIVPCPVFDVDAVLATISHEKITMLPGPPTLYFSILDHPGRDRHDLTSLRLAVTGAAAIPVELIHRMRRELTFRTIVTGYGLTEVTGIATMCRHDDDPETIARTSGRAIPGVEVLVVNAEGKELPRGEPGELVVRGYNVMAGYLDDPAATLETIDGDGWLHTGDVGVMDERGYVRITDRTKDMFIVGGFNAYPAEIENLLLANEKIAQVAVIGVPDARLGEVGKAFVVLRPGASATPEELVAWARAEMANYKAPRSVEILDALPLNASGKVLKYELRNR